MNTYICTAILIIISLFVFNYFKKKNKEIIRILNNQRKKEKIEEDKILQSFKYQGILDNLPNSFKEYLLNNNAPKKIDQLKRNLDSRSISIINNAIKKIIQLPDSKYCEYLYYSDKEYRKNFETVFDKEFNKLYSENHKSITKDYKLAKNDYDYEVFLYHHGLKFANANIKKYVSGKDFIDAGAYIGDSALVMFEYNPRKIYSFEISDSSISAYYETMNINNKNTAQFEIIKLGLFNEKKTLSINDTANLGTNLINAVNATSTIEVTDLDSIVNEKQINVGFIKADLEGAMYKALIGMKNTIKKYRPILSFAIYHSPEEFFLTKPLLEKITENLNYKIEIDCHFSSPYHIFGLIIWAYPKELAIVD